MEPFKRNFASLIFLLIPILFTAFKVYAQQENPFQYVSPKPNSEMVSNETNIILRHTNKLQEATIVQKLITVIGSKSGTHTGEFSSFRR